MPIKRLKIVEITATWPAEVFIQRHIQTLFPLDINLHLVAHSSRREYTNLASIQEADVSIPVTILPIFNNLSYTAKILVLLKFGLSREIFEGRRSIHRRVLLTFFQRLQADLIHFHNAQLAASLKWICQDLGIPYTVSLRGADVQEIPLRSAEVGQATRSALLNAAGIHVVCRHLGQFANLLGLEYTPIYTPIILANPLPPYRSRDQGEFRFLSVGRIHWRKGFPDLLVALRGLLDSDLRAHLTIVGSGPDEERVKYWIEKLDLGPFVNIFGKASFYQIQELLISSHGYIQASLIEGLSNAMAEALCWGCPVFATDVGGTAEVIQDGKTGFLLKPSCPKDWIEQLKQVQDIHLMEIIRDNAYQVASERFAPKVHGQRFLDFYQRAIAVSSDSKTSQKNQSVVYSRLSSMPSQDESGRKRILVWGPWNWARGTDRVLLALGFVAQSNHINPAIVGSGSLEDEVRYLAHKFGFNPSGVVRLPDSEAQNRQIEESWLDWGDVTIDLTRGDLMSWQVRSGKQVWEVDFGDVTALSRVVSQAIR